MRFELSPAIRALRLADVTDALDGGTLTYYSGTQPAFGVTAGVAPQAQATLTSPAGTLSGLTFTLTLPIAAMRTDAAAITWARYADSTGAIVADCDVTSTSTGTGAILLDNTSGPVGAFVEITSATLTG